MLSPLIKEKVEEKFGRPIRYSKDCDHLAAEISYHTNNQISGSTIRRLWGFAPSVQEPREYTLDVLSNYVGAECYEDLIKEFDVNAYSEFETIQELSTDTLQPNNKVKLKYEPGRELTLQYICDNTFEVVESKNCKLLEHDRVVFQQVVHSYPLFIKGVIRLDKNLGKYTAGKVSGITHIEILKD